MRCKYVSKLRFYVIFILLVFILMPLVFILLPYNDINTTSPHSSTQDGTFDRLFSYIITSSTNITDDIEQQQQQDKDYEDTSHLNVIEDGIIEEGEMKEEMKEEMKKNKLNAKKEDTNNDVKEEEEGGQVQTMDNTNPPSQGDKKLMTLIVAGFQKCGTSVMAAYLSSHPEIAFSRIKVRRWKSRAAANAIYHAHMPP